MKCVACKPGYRPYYATTPTLQTVWPTIDSCQAIENCKDLQNGFVGRWMNGCYNCIHFYDYWNVSSTTGILIDFTKCVAERGNVTMTNCYAAYHSGPCMVCKKGFVKNANQECVTQTVSMCQQYNLWNNAATGNGVILDTASAKKLNSYSLQIYLFYSEPFSGCTSCQSHYISLPIDNTSLDNAFYPYMCTSNPLNTMFPTGTSVIANCANYGLKDPLLTTGVPATNLQLPNLLTCFKCNTGFVLTMDNQCTPQNDSTLKDCELANEMNGTTCKRCIAGKLNVAGVCLTITATTPILNCTTYDMNGSFELPYALCTKCADGFYVSADSRLCLTIPLDNCATWGQDVPRGKTWCLTCKQNFLLIERSNEQQYCFPISFATGLPDSQELCVQWDGDRFKNRELECTKCKLGPVDDYFKIKSADILRKTECLPFITNNVSC